MGIGRQSSNRKSTGTIQNENGKFQLRKGIQSIVTKFGTDGQTTSVFRRMANDVELCHG